MLGDPTHENIDEASFLCFNAGELAVVDLIDYDKYELQTEKSLFDSLLL